MNHNLKQLQSLITIPVNLRKGAVIIIQLSSAATLVNVDKSVEESWKLHPSRFLSWKRLIRVLAWVLRFINNCKQENKLSQV